MMPFVPCSSFQWTITSWLDGLIEKDLIAFDGTLFQVLDLPATPPTHTRREGRSHHHAVRRILRQALEGEADGR
jgi:hypothetical protein